MPWPLHRVFFLFCILVFVELIFVLLLRCEFGVLAGR